MPRKPKPVPVAPPELQLKTWALRDDPLVHTFRDMHYRLILDSLQATGQRIATGEKVVPLSDAARKRLMSRFERICAKIRKKYRLAGAGWGGGSPYNVRRADLLSTLEVRYSPPMTSDTNWMTSRSPRVRFFCVPVGAKKLRSRSGPTYQLPPDPECPLDDPPTLTIHVDLSQVNTRDLDRLASEFKQHVKQSLRDLPQAARKRPSTWQRKNRTRLLPISTAYVSGCNVPMDCRHGEK
ncbi:MAG: hypothetical protein ABI980_11010 [Nitrospirota bacterium]